MLTDLQFEDEGAARAGKVGATTPQQAGHSVRMLCSLISEPQSVGVSRLKQLGPAQIMCTAYLPDTIIAAAKNMNHS